MMLRVQVSGNFFFKLFSIGMNCRSCSIAKTLRTPSANRALVSPPGPAPISITTEDSVWHVDVVNAHRATVRLCSSDMRRFCPNPRFKFRDAGIPRSCSFFLAALR